MLSENHCDDFKKHKHLFINKYNTVYQHVKDNKAANSPERRPIGPKCKQIQILSCKYNKK